ncbi:hypothetical protein ACH4OW_24975 [Streptomyces sp. NPDC017056]|uniref:hypothetical protein n=1 Tax=Streptomyces sp. NPDC017056 TaxID=3364973 RepID=UPI0037A1B02A
MTEKTMTRFAPTTIPLLATGERLLDIAPVVPVSGVKGVGGVPGAGVGNALARVGGVGGNAEGLARQLPTESPAGFIRKLLWVSDARVGLTAADPHGNGQLLWAVSREQVAAVRRSPRLQLMARFRLHFADGSFLAFMTMRRRNTEALAGAVGE